MKKNSTLLIAASLLVLLVFSSLQVFAERKDSFKQDKEKGRVSPQIPSFACQQTFQGYNISTVAPLDSVQLGLGVVAFVLPVTLPANVALTSIISAYVQKGSASLPDAHNVELYELNSTLKNVTVLVQNGTACATIEYNYTAVANVSNNFEGWYAVNITSCSPTFAGQQQTLNDTVWIPLQDDFSFAATITKWLKVVTKYKPTLGYTAYDTYINITGLSPCYVWQNTSYTFRKNLSVTNGWGRANWMPLFISRNVTSNATQMMSNCSDVKIADDFNGEYPVVWQNCNASGGGYWVAPNISADSTWTGNASIYYNGTPGDVNGNLVFKNFTGFWTFSDRNDSKGQYAMDVSNSSTPTIRAGDDGVCKFGRCMNFSASTMSNASIQGLRSNGTDATIWIRGSRNLQSQNIYWSSTNCEYTAQTGLLVFSTSTSNFLVSARAGNTQLSCGTPTLDAMFELMLTVDAGGMTCFLNGVNTSLSTTMTSFNGITGFSINRGGMNNGLFNGGCGGWLEYNGGVGITDLLAFANFSTGREGLALFNMTGITATSEWSQFEVQAAAANVAPLVTLISPADGIKQTTGTLSFQFNASDGDNTTFFGATLWRNATNASYLATIAANFTVTMNISSHPVGNFTWNITLDDGVDMGNSSKRTYMVVPANTAPTVSLVAPLAANISNTATFVNYSATVADDENTTLQWCAARLNTTIVLGNVTSVTSPGSFNVSTNRTEGNYSWNIICSDGISETSGSARAIQIVPVNAAPTVSLNAPSSGTKVTTGTTAFQFTPSDLTNATLFDCTLLRNSTNVSSIATTPQGFLATFNYSIPVGNWSWTTSCFDGSLTGTSSANTLMSVPANTAPTVTLNSPADAATITAGFINFTYTPSDSDNATINDCTLLRNTTNISYTTSLTQGSLTNFSIVSTSSGNYSWNITCNDGLLSGTSSVRTFKVIPAIPPNITLLSPTNLTSTYVRKFTNFTFNITAVNNVTLAWCSLQRNTTLVTNVTNFPTDVAGLSNNTRNFTISPFTVGNNTWRINCSDGTTDVGAERIISVLDDSWWWDGSVRYVMEDFASTRTLNWTTTGSYLVSYNGKNLSSRSSVMPDLARHNFSSSVAGESIKLANFTMQGNFTLYIDTGNATSFSPLFIFTSDNITGYFDATTEPVPPPSGGYYLYLTVSNNRWGLIAGTNGSSISTSISGGLGSGIIYQYVINRTMIENNIYNTSVRINGSGGDFLSLRENTTLDGFQNIYFGEGVVGKAYRFDLLSFNITTQNFSSGTTPNLPPFIVNISVSPANANTQSSLSCKVNVTDDFDTLIPVDVNWFNNTVNMTQFASTNYVLANEYELAGNITPASLTFNHNWSCSAQAHDNAMLYSGRNLSKNVTLVLPVLSVVNVSPENNVGNLSQNSPYKFLFNVTGNTSQANCTLRFNNTVMNSVNYTLPTNNANFSLVGAGGLSRGAKNWTINCTDGEGGSVVTPYNTFFVMNTPPVIAYLNFTPEFHYINTQTVNATVRATDFDNDLINYTTSWSGGDSDDVLNGQTAGNSVTSGNTTVGVQVWTYNVALTGTVVARDDFNSGSNSTSASFSANTSNSVPKITSVEVKDIVNTIGGIIRWEVDVIDADSNTDPTNAYLRFSQYNLTLQKTGGSSSKYLFNFSIGANNASGNFSWNVTVSDDRNNTLVQFMDRNVTINPVSGVFITGRANSFQKNKPIRIGRARNEQFEYLRQISVTNKNLLPSNVSVNTTLPIALNNATVNVTDSNGNIIAFSINTSDYYINWTTNITANTTTTYNVTYNLSVLQTLNYSSQCDGEGTSSGTCSVKFRIANNHTAKINNVSFILEDVDLPHWDSRGSITVLFKLIGGTGGGGFEKWLINASSNESSIYTNYSFTNGTTSPQGGGITIQSTDGGSGGEDSGTGTSTNLAKTFSNSSILESNYTSNIDTSTNNTISDFQIGSLIVKGLDLGADSTYELSADYAWSTASGSGDAPSGGGGGLSMLGTTSAPLQIGNANETYKIETDRGAGKYELFASAGQTREKTVKITNTGSIAGIVTIKCESAQPLNACNNVLFETDNVPLVPSQSKTLTFTATVPKDFAGNNYEFNVVVQGASETITGRLPVTITVSSLGALFAYGDKITSNFVIESPVVGGRDLKLPVILVALVTLLVVAGGVGYLFSAIMGAGTKVGWVIGFLTGIVFAIGIPFFA